jgi:putative endonuclease
VALVLVRKLRNVRAPRPDRACVTDPFFISVLAGADGPRPMLDTGVTNDLRRRIAEHPRAPSGFAQRYNVAKLVYFEWSASVREAIALEKRIEGWARAKKLALIRTASPYWHELGPRLRRRGRRGGGP